MLKIGPEFEVPANASRFFEDQEIALSQPLASIQLVQEKNGFIHNVSFEPSLIQYDSSYCTSNANMKGRYSSPTLDYIPRIFARMGVNDLIIDIGCGQGEFVKELRRMGRNAIGFDPVIRSESSFLHRRLWTSTESPAALYVMRCVLPHIENPFSFIHEIGAFDCESMVLIEYQRLEWIVEHQIWYQISHDHVNLFTIHDFQLNFDVLDHGVFANGEWGWVLVDPRRISKLETNASLDIHEGINELFNTKSVFLDNVSTLESQLIVWGAAGKGIVLSHAIASVKGQISSIDADENRWGLYMESSGTPIFSPEKALVAAERDSVILVCNPNHLSEIKAYVGDGFDVLLPKELIFRSR